MQSANCLLYIPIHYISMCTSINTWYDMTIFRLFNVTPLQFCSKITLPSILHILYLFSWRFTRSLEVGSCDNGESMPLCFFRCKSLRNRGGEHNFCLTRCHGISSCLSYEMHLYWCTLWAQTVCRVSIERQARRATKLTEHRKRKQIEEILVLQGVNVASDPRFPHHPIFFWLSCQNGDG